MFKVQSSRFKCPSGVATSVAMSYTLSPHPHPSPLPSRETGSKTAAVVGVLILLTLTAVAPTVCADDDAIGRYIPDDFFGTTSHVNGAWMLPLLKDLNLHVVRVDFIHHALEPVPGQYHFGDDHWVIRSADLGIEHGLDQLAVVTTYDTYERIAADPDAFEKFAFAIASKYKQKIRYWQASNEPDVTKPARANQYVIMLKAFYRGVKRADPDNQVVLAGQAGEGHRRLDIIYELGGKGYFDILASHSYTRPRLPEEGGYLQRIASIRKTMQKHGEDKPLWVTEMGWNGVEASMLEYLRAKYPSHRAYSGTEETQARGLARLYLLSATEPWIKRVYFFNLAQQAAYDEENHNGDAYIGIVGPWVAGQNRPKDAYFAVKTVIAMIGRATYQGRIDLGPRLWALAFTRDDKATVALWSLDDGITMKLTDTSKITGVTSMVGTPILIRDDALQLTGRPIYVHCNQQDLDALRQQIAGAAVHGQQDLRVTLSLDRQRTQAASAPVLSVQVANISRRQVVPGPIRLKIAEPWRAAVRQITFDAPLQPEQVEQRGVHLTGPDMRPGEFRIFAEARPERGMRTRQTICYATFLRRAFDFSADGKLDEWAAVRPVELPKTEAEREIADWRGPDDCSARWYAAWDDKALYFAADVRDDAHHQPYKQNAASSLWMGDSIQLALDMGDDAAPSANAPAFDGRNDVELGLALSPDGPIACFSHHPDGGDGHIVLSDLTVSRDEQAKRTRYEAAIPWQQLGWTEPVANRWMGMNLLVNDNDGGDRRGALQWSPGLIYQKNPALFAKVLLLAPSVSP